MLRSCFTSSMMSHVKRAGMVNFATMVLNKNAPTEASGQVCR